MCTLKSIDSCNNLKFTTLEQLLVDIQFSCRVVILFFLCNENILIAQEQDTIHQQNINLTGTLYAELQYDGISGQNQNRPKWIRTFLITPSLSIPGFPVLNFNFKISSLENTIRQPFNRFSLNTTWGWGDLFLGDAYPVYSSLTLNGILVRGVNFDINPGVFRLACVIGDTKRAVEGSQGIAPSFKQTLYGFKIGLGKKNGSEINLNFIKVKDDPNSITIAGYKTPQENVVTSLNGQLKLFDNKLHFTGEFAVNALSRDIRSLTVNTSDKIPSFLLKIFTPRISSQYDYAFNIESKMIFRSSLLRLYFKNINPSFYSLSTPYLKNDVRSFGLSGNHQLVTNKINLTASYDQTRDNLFKLKSTTTSSYSGYLRSDFMFYNLPMFNVSYRFYLQKNNALLRNQIVNNLLQTAGAGANHQFKISEVTNSVTAIYSFNWFRSKSFYSLPNTNYNFHSVNFSSNSRLMIPLTFTGSLGFSSYNYPKTNDLANKRWVYGIGAAYSFFDGKLTSSISFSNTSERTGLINQFIYQKMFSLLFKSEFKTQNQSIILRLERMVFTNRSMSSENYREFLMQLVYLQQLGI